MIKEMVWSEDKEGRGRCESKEQEEGESGDKDESFETCSYAERDGMNQIYRQGSGGKDLCLIQKNEKERFS